MRRRLAALAAVGIGAAVPFVGLRAQPTAPPPAANRPEAAAERRQWAARVNAALSRHKRYPQALRAKARAEGTPAPAGRVLLAFAVYRDGSLAALSIRESSGHPDLDEAAVQMVRAAAPLPVPPRSLGGERLDLVLPVAFTAGP